MGSDKVYPITAQTIRDDNQPANFKNKVTISEIFHYNIWNISLHFVVPQLVVGLVVLVAAVAVVIAIVVPLTVIEEEEPLPVDNTVMDQGRIFLEIFFCRKYFQFWWSLGEPLERLWTEGWLTWRSSYQAAQYQNRQSLHTRADPANTGGPQKKFITRNVHITGIRVDLI